MPFTYPLFPQMTRASLRMLTVAGAATVLLGLSKTASAQTPPTASATIQLTSSGSLNSYALTLNDSVFSLSPVGTFWFAWVPGEDLMSFSPTNITSPPGWTPYVENGYYSGGHSIEWMANSAGADVLIGGSLQGFGFSSAETPDMLASNSQIFPSTPTLTAYMYSGGPFSDAGTQLVVSEVVAPEPVSIAAMAPLAVLLCRRSRTQ
jgi:hypothetical protein